MEAITNRVVLITGGGRGIGAATAKLFAKKHYKVCITYLRNRDTADTVKHDIEAAGGQCLAIQTDVADETQVVELFQRIDTELGALSVLVNNAGILRPQTKLKDMDGERITAILNNNVLSAFLCSREAVKRMAVSDGGNGGTIVNVSSLAASTGAPNEYIDYAASKGAMDSLTRGLAREVANENIRVNSVRPGLIYTDMHRDGGEPGRVDRLKQNIPLGRGGKPEEVAEAIYWLASNKSSFTTGDFIDLAGGL